MSLANVKKGDSVVVVFNGYRRSDEPTVNEFVVSNAGPKYVSVQQYSRTRRFCRETGKEAGAGNYPAYAYAERADYEAFLVREQREDRAARLAREFRASRYSDTQLLAVIAALEAA